MIIIAICSYKTVTQPVTYLFTFKLLIAEIV